MADNETKITVLTPELRESLKGELKTIEDTAFAKGRDAGATAERERIQGVEAASYPGHEKLIEQMKFDGKSTRADASVAVLDAEKKKVGGKLADIRSDAPGAVAATDPAKTDAVKNEEKKPANPVGLARRAAEYQAQQKAKGVEVSNVEAINFAYQEAGVPLK